MQGCLFTRQTFLELVLNAELVSGVGNEAKTHSSLETPSLVAEFPKQLNTAEHGEIFQNWTLQL